MILIRNKDFKSERWAAALSQDGTSVGYFSSPRKLLKLIRQQRRIQEPVRAIVFRYLNDFSSFSRSFKKFKADVFCIVIAKTFGVTVLWICHNVDKETREFHPLLASLRRAVVAAGSRRILVTDPLLVEESKKVFPKPWRRKLGWVCFGALGSYGSHKPWGSDTEPWVGTLVRDFVQSARSQKVAGDPPVLIGLCLSRSRDKMLHYDYARELIECAASCGFSVRLIVAVDYDNIESVSRRNNIDKLSDMPEVLLFRKEIGFNELLMRDYYDFFWRGVDDISMSITAYVAATVEKPILSLRCGFLPVVIERYSLGAVVDKDFSGLHRKLNDIQHWKSTGAKRFLEERTWGIGARNLAESAPSSKKWP